MRFLSCSLRLILTLGFISPEVQALPPTPISQRTMSIAFIDAVSPSALEQEKPFVPMKRQQIIAKTLDQIFSLAKVPRNKTFFDLAERSQFLSLCQLLFENGFSVLLK